MEPEYDDGPSYLMQASHGNHLPVTLVRINHASAAIIKNEEIGYAAGAGSKLGGALWLQQHGCLR